MNTKQFYSTEAEAKKAVKIALDCEDVCRLPALTARNRTSLYEFHRRYTAKHAIERCAPYISIDTSCCGKVYTYQNSEDVPEKSIKCDCGSRWLFWYTDEKGEYREL